MTYVLSHRARTLSFRLLVAIFAAAGSTAFAEGNIDFPSETPVSTSPSAYRPLKALHSVVELATTGVAVAVAWSSDGSSLAAASNYGNNLSIWTREGKKENEFPTEGGPNVLGSLVFANGSSEVGFVPPDALPDSASISLWEVSSGRLIKTVVGPHPSGLIQDNRGKDFKTSPDQSLLALSTLARSSNIAVYETKNWSLVHTLTVAEGVASLSIFKNGTLLAVGVMNEGRAKIIDVQSGAEMASLQVYAPSPIGDVSIGAIAGSVDGRLLMVGAGQILISTPSRSEEHAWLEALDTVQIINASDGKIVRSLKAPVPPVRYAAWDPRDQFVAFVDNARMLYVWGREGTLLKQKLRATALCLAIAPDSRRIAVTTDTGIHVFSVE